MRVHFFPLTLLTRMFFLVMCTLIASAVAEADAAQSCNLLQRGSTHASPLLYLEQTERAGISAVPGATKLRNSALPSKDCVIIVALATRSMDTLKENLPYFKPYCDVITGHYDLDSDSFIKHAWFQEVAALAVDKPYYNKIELVEDLLANHRDTLFLYKTAFIMDDDVALHTMQVGDFVDFGRDGPYFLLAPTIHGKHAWHTQDPVRHHKKRRCDVLQTDAIEQQAVLLKISRLDDFVGLVLEENRDNNRRIPCDWGFPRFVCRGLDQNTGTGCAIAGKFGAVVHKDLNSQTDIDLALLQRDAPCATRGDFVIQQNHFRNGRLYEAEATFKCFSVSAKQDSTENRFLLQRDTSWKPWFPIMPLAGPKVKKVVALQEFCKKRFEDKAYLSDLTKPNNYLSEDGIYHVHIPKVAGESFKADAAEISKANVFSEEVCLSDYPTSGKHLVLLREPRAHVLSQYYFCKDSDDPGPSRANFLMPKDISEWINFWTRFVSTGNWRENFQYGPKTKFNTPWCSSRLPFGCYSPVNLQSQRLTCKEGAYDYSSHVSDDAAIKKLDKVYFVGIQEAYQESLCLLHGMTHDHLPEWCDCTNKKAWSKATVTKETHGSVPHDFSELSQETQEEVDNLTAGDAALYKAGVKRFVHDVRKLEKRLNGQILCKKKLKELNAL